MTTLTRPVSRRTERHYCVLRHRKERQIITTLLPGDVLEFREAGCRQRWTLPIDETFRIAVRCKAGMALCFVPVRKKK